MPYPRKKKKVDTEALHSPLNRIPSIDIRSVRDLIDIGLNQIDELKGRAPECLFEEIRKIKPETPPDRLQVLKMAVYFAETPDPDPAKMKPWIWI